MALSDHLSPGRGVAFKVRPGRSWVYRVVQVIARTIVRFWFRPAVHGAANVPAEGPVILAPVHRSFADFSFSIMVTDRKLFFMAKDSLWRSRALGWLLTSLGAFPVHREGVDREALARAREILDRGQLLVMFPEGTRQEGPLVQELHGGVAFLAARSGARIVPMGIGGSDLSMPKGTTVPKRLPITLIVGEPVDPPSSGSGGRVARSQVHQTTLELREAIQKVYDEARG